MTGRQSGINLFIFKMLLKSFRSCKVLNWKENLGSNNKEVLERQTITSESSIWILLCKSIYAISQKPFQWNKAQGGCQAECGSAAAMAAASIVELAGGSPRQAADAVAIALKNILGLVCDPVAGLVEIPCIKRNASGVAGAFVAAELALAGIESAIPADEVIVAMKKVGDAMSPALKETAEGGLAATPTARRLYEQVFGRPLENALRATFTDPKVPAKEGFGYK